MSLTRQTFLITFWIVLAIGLPIPEKTENEILRGWVSEPRGRGTFSILTSCGATLGLCVWTAIHPDVRASLTIRKRLEIRLRWMLTALHTPDQVVMSAYRQWRSAENIHKQWIEPESNVPAGNGSPNTKKEQERGSDNTNPDTHSTQKNDSGVFEVKGNSIDLKNGTNATTGQENNGDDPAQTLATPAQYDNDRKNVARSCAESGDSKGSSQITKEEMVDHSYDIQSPKGGETGPAKPKDDCMGKEGAFFFVMGGFVTQKGNRWDEQTFNRVLAWQRDNINSQLKRADIIDKGKASPIAKAVVCVQASWLVIQLIARTASGLPMSLLELHVVIHILVTAVIYGFWWNKPLDVNEPITLDIIFGPGMEVENLSKAKGLLDIRDTYSSFISVFKSTRRSAPKSESDSATQSKGDSQSEMNKSSSPPPTETEIEPEIENSPVQKGSGSKHNTSPSPPPSTETNTSSDTESKPLSQETSGSEPNISPSPTANDTSSNVEPGLLAQTVNNTTESTYSGKAKSQDSVSTFSNDSTTPSIFTKDVTKILKDNWQALIFYIIYAGLHAAAWNAEFPTMTERWLWRCSCLLVGVAPITLVLIQFFERLVNDDESLCKDEATTKLGLFFVKLNEYIRHTLRIIYLIGSGYLLVESFISLRCLPSGVYKTVVWENYIPHF